MTATESVSHPVAPTAECLATQALGPPASVMRKHFDQAFFYPSLYITMHTKFNDR
jgi:hypothetical protein